MAMTLSDMYLELAQHAVSHNEDLLAHISRMAALEARNKSIPLPILGWNVLGIWDWDVIGDVVYMEERCAELFDVPPDAARKGLPISDFVKAMHPDDTARVTDAIMETLRRGGPFECRYRVIANGRTRNVVARGACTLDASGRAARFPGLILELPTAVS